MSSNIESISGKAIPLRGDDIDTDRIIPARFLRCVTFDGLGEHAFEDDRLQDPKHSFDNPAYESASILFAANNFGCGSSREHAPQSLQKWGIKAIVAISYAEIFFGNCNAMGIPCLTVGESELEKLYQAVETNPDLAFKLDVSTAIISSVELTVQGDIPTGVRESLLNGTWNATSVHLESIDKIEAMAEKLPYFSNYA